MKKMLLFISAFILFGCGQMSNSYYYNAVEVNSVSNTVENLSQSIEEPIEYNGTTTLINGVYDMWNVGEDIAILSDTNQSVVSMHLNILEAEEVSLLLSNYDIEVSDEIRDLIDAENLTLDPDNDYYLEFDTKAVDGNEVIVIIRRNFEPNETEELIKTFELTIYFDEFLGELAKSELIK